MELKSIGEFADSINECIAVGYNIESQNILVKNRDRKYNPIIEIIHKIRNGVEIAYMRDCLTDWCEGINEYGIAVINSTLEVYVDEKAGNVSVAKVDTDGIAMRRALTCRNIKDVISTLIKNNFYGHTIIMSPDECYHLEYTSRNKPSIKKIENYKTEPFVTTNHGMNYKQEGYFAPDQEEIKKISSDLRLKNAIINLKQAKTPEDTVELLRVDLFDRNSYFNTFRKTGEMNTTSQILMNCTNKELIFYYDKTRIERIEGVKNRLPVGYTPKIKIKIERIEENYDDNPTYNVFSYGSNMQYDRIQKRFDKLIIPTQNEIFKKIDPNEVNRLDTGSIKGYKLVFNKRGKDGTAKANVIYTGNLKDIVYGVIYRMKWQQIQKLDEFEYGYSKSDVVVDSKNNNTIDCQLYIANPDFVEDNLSIDNDYYKYCLDGAIQNKLPTDYINDNIRSQKDRINTI